VVVIEPQNTAVPLGLILVVVALGALVVVVAVVLVVANRNRGTPG
jgi:uncharacterized membrane protein